MKGMHYKRSIFYSKPWLVIFWLASFTNLLILQPSSCLNADEFNLLGKPGEGYYLETYIGTPSQIFNVLVDTGSTNLAIAAAPAEFVDAFFNASQSTSYETHHHEVTVLYTQGYWKGELGSDFVEFPSLAVPQLRADIVAIKTSHNFYMNGSRWQGILGLAYPRIAKPEGEVVSWLDSFASLNHTSVAFSLELCGSKDGEDVHVGKFHMLHKDDNPHPPVLRSPVTQEGYYELLLTKIEVGHEVLNHPCQDLNTKRTIVDSGTTNLRLPDKVFSSVVQLLHKQVEPVALNLTEEFWLQQKVTCMRNSLELRHFFPRIRLSLLQTKHSYFSLELPPESYIRKVDVPESSNCYKFGIQSSDTGTVLGAVVMQGFLIVFNRTDKSVGFMPSTSCGPPVSIFGPFSVTEDLRKCAPQAKSPVVGALSVVGYIVSALMSVVAVVVVYILIKWLWESYLQRPDWSSLSQSNLLTQE